MLIRKVAVKIVDREANGSKQCCRHCFANACCIVARLAAETYAGWCMGPSAMRMSSL